MSQYYESNKAYNPQSSNRPIIQVVQPTSAMNKPSVAEGAMWGATQGALLPAAYSAALYGIKTGNAEAVSRYNEGLGEKFGKAQKFLNDVGDVKKSAMGKINEQVEKNVSKPVSKLAKGVGSFAFGSGAKSIAGRIAVGAAIGGTQGALHNASNGIVGPY